MLKTEIKESDWKSFEEIEIIPDIPYWFRQENGNVVLAFYVRGQCTGWAKAFVDKDGVLKCSPNEFYILRNAKLQPAIEVQSKEKEMKQFEEGQKLEFDVYGNIIKGKFIKLTGNLIEIEVEYDSLDVSEIGEKTTISSAHLIS